MTVYINSVRTININTMYGEVISIHGTLMLPHDDIS